MADHQYAIISEKLKLLKISSLKTERKPAVVGVLKDVRAQNFPRTDFFKALTAGRN